MSTSAAYSYFESKPDNYFTLLNMLHFRYSQVSVLDSVEGDRTDGCHDDGHTQSDGDKKHDDVFCPIQQGVIVHILGICILTTWLLRWWGYRAHLD